MRFATGTPSLPAIHAARAGIEMVAKVGVRRVRERNVRLMERFIEAASAEGLAIRSPRDPRQRSGVVCVDFPGAEGAEAALRRRGFHVDYRPQCGVRASAHFYTTEDEILSLVPELVRLRRRSGRGGATRAHAIAPGR
jgi:kynureninase